MPTIDKMELKYKGSYYFLISLSFLIIPILFFCILSIPSVKSDFFILWISANIFQIAIWWLFVPVKDKPLSQLNSVSKEIFDLNISSDLHSSKINLEFCSIIDLRKEIEKNLHKNWLSFKESSSFLELKKIHNILNESNQYSRENRCQNVPYPPYHLGAQILGKDINDILVKYRYMAKNNFPGLIEDSVEYETNKGTMIMKFKFELINCENRKFLLCIEFEHSHNEYIFVSSPKVYIKE